MVKLFDFKVPLVLGGTLSYLYQGCWQHHMACKGVVTHSPSQKKVPPPQITWQMGHVRGREVHKSRCFTFVWNSAWSSWLRSSMFSQFEFVVQKTGYGDFWCNKYKGDQPPRMSRGPPPLFTWVSSGCPCIWPQYKDRTASWLPSSIIGPNIFLRVL